MTASYCRAVRKASYEHLMREVEPIESLLRELLRSEGNVGDTLLGLTEPERAKRFQTTGQVLDALDTAKSKA